MTILEMHTCVDENVVYRFRTCADRNVLGLGRCDDDKEPLAIVVPGQRNFNSLFKGGKGGGGVLINHPTDGNSSH